MSKIKLKAYYYHEESDSFFIDKLDLDSNMWNIIKIGLAIKPSTKDFKLKVQKRTPVLKDIAQFYVYDNKTKSLIDKSPF